MFATHEWIPHVFLNNLQIDGRKPGDCCNFIILHNTYVQVQGNPSPSDSCSLCQMIQQYT